MGEERTTLKDFHSDIVRMLNEDKSYCTISKTLITNLGYQKRGFSARSIRRYCVHAGINRGSLKDVKLRRDVCEVANAISMTGPSYGRRTLKAYLKSTGVVISSKRLSGLQKLVSPLDAEGRRRRAKASFNPERYFVRSFGHKLHVDQNEKLVDFGVVHVAGIDGYSRYIVAACTMPVKNNLTIYSHILKKTVERHGVWMQIRLDHGTEFNLLEHMQNSLSSMRVECGHQAVLRTQSKLNLRIERLWFDINERVNYPIKIAMQDLVNEDQLDLGDELHKLVLSHILVPLASKGMEIVVNSWNLRVVEKNRHSRLPAGVPAELLHENKCLAQVPGIILPNENDAAALYERDVGGTLTRPKAFGTLPSTVNPQQFNDFMNNFWTVNDINFMWAMTVNRRYNVLKSAVLSAINHFT